MNSDIESITIPASVREIGTGAFYNCKNLRKVTFEEKSRLERIGKECFYGSSIKELIFSPTLSDIGTNAFDNCGNL